MHAFADSPVRGITIEPGGGTLLAAVGREEDSALFFWRSRDHGATWEPVSLLVPRETSPLTGYPHFAFDLSRPGTLYVWLFERVGEFFSHEGPLFRSRDGGATWAELPSPVRALRDLVPLSDGTLLAGSASQGATRSFDQGDSWPPGSWQHPVPHASVIRIVALPGDRRTLVAAGDGGAWRSTDGAETWVASNQGLAAIGVGSLLVAPTEPPFLITRAGDAVFRSADHGATWTRIEAELPWRLLGSLQGFDPHHPRTVFAFGTEDRLADVLFKSTNAGRTWQSLPVPYSCNSTHCWVIMRAFAVDPQNPDTLFVGGEYFERYGTVSDFLVRSDDDFATSKKLTPIHGLRTLAVVSGKPDTLYGLNCRRLYRSQDGAKTWQRVGRGLPLRLCPREGWDRRGTLVLDPRDPERLYVGTAGKGVYASTDGGLTFRAMNRGLETAGVTAILIDPTDSTKLYAGTDGQGVGRWSAKWKTWAPLNDGLPTAWFRWLLAIDPRRPTVLYAGASIGIFRIDLGEVVP